MPRKDLYKSKVWDRVRLNVWIQQYCLCARCGNAVYVSGLSPRSSGDERLLKGIVHHKEYITDDNYTDDAVALDESNLEGICINCHNKEHFQKEYLRSDVMFDEYGNLIKK